MKTVLITAFGQFGNYLANTTELVAKALRGHNLCSSFKVETVVFDCVIPEEGCDRGLILLDYIQRTNSCAVISLGMASDKTGMCLESAAYNAVESKYCPPEKNGKTIDDSCPYGAKVEMDISQWNLQVFASQCAQENIPCMDMSEDPGLFCCNHLMYQVHRLQSSGEFAIPFIFVHVPCSMEAVADHQAHRSTGKTFMPTGQIISGLRLLTESLSI